MLLKQHRINKRNLFFIALEVGSLILGSQPGQALGCHLFFSQERRPDNSLNSLYKGINFIPECSILWPNYLPNYIPKSPHCNNTSPHIVITPHQGGLGAQHINIGGIKYLIHSSYFRGKCLCGILMVPNIEYDPDKKTDLFVLKDRNMPRRKTDIIKHLNLITNFSYWDFFHVFQNLQIFSSDIFITGDNGLYIKWWI